MHEFSLQRAFAKDQTLKMSISFFLFELSLTANRKQSYIHTAIMNAT